MIRVHRLHLACASFWVDVRLLQADGKWIASADTADGPTMGLGWLPEEALMRALEVFGDLIDELLETVPDDFHWTRRARNGG